MLDDLRPSTAARSDETMLPIARRPGSELPAAMGLDVARSSRSPAPSAGCNQLRLPPLPLDSRRREPLDRGLLGVIGVPQPLGLAGIGLRDTHAPNEIPEARRPPLSRPVAAPRAAATAAVVAAAATGGGGDKDGPGGRLPSAYMYSRSAASVTAIEACDVVFTIGTAITPIGDVPHCAAVALPPVGANPASDDRRLVSYFEPPGVWKAAGVLGAEPDCPGWTRANLGRPTHPDTASPDVRMLALLVRGASMIS